jgi:hypothetical protein
METDEYLDEILFQLKISNRLLATLLVEQHRPLDEQGYAPDEMPLKEFNILTKLKEAMEAISK